MAKDFAEQLKRISVKSEMLCQRQHVLQQENTQLQERCGELQAELEELRRRNESLERELEFLRISSAVAPNAATVADAKAYLSDLVREIDLCIAEIMREL